MAEVDGFCIDRYEAHLVTRAAGGETTAHAYFERPIAGVVYEAQSEARAFPQGYVSRIESAAACSAADKRLCTMREWKRACEGTKQTFYPYGPRWESGRCNTDKAHLLSLLFGWDPHHWHYADFNDPSLDREPGFLTRTGELRGCVSDVGVYDLVGNLHEWVSDDVDGALVGRLEGQGITRAYQPWASGNGVFMGGFFSTHEQHGPGCEFTTLAHEPGYHDYSTGFRCCEDESSQRRDERSSALPQSSPVTRTTKP